MRRNVEIERRWIVLGHDGSIAASPSIGIEQGYLDVPGSLRVRITTTEHGGRSYADCELTRKEGKGIERLETSAGLTEEAARMLIDTTTARLLKTRYLRDGWECDFFHGPLEGLVLLERELRTRDEPVELPTWITSATEVTHILTNKQLATAGHLIQGGRFDPSDAPWGDVPTVVLTGPPCGGKSSIIRMLQADPGIHCVPEVATIIMGQVGITPDVVEEGLFQRTMYRVQRSFEDAAARQARKMGKRALVIDRGTLDCAAFMREGVLGFERTCGTTVASEYDRYDAVIMLDALSQEDYEVHKGSNPVRRETWEQAKEAETRLVATWEGHPCLIRVPGTRTLDQKRDRVASIIEETVGSSGRRSLAV